MLALIEFVKYACLFTEELYRHPLDYKTQIKAGITNVTYNGNKYTAVKQGTEGWTWVCTGGKVPRPNPPVFFAWSDPIYLQKRYDERAIDLSKLDRMEDGVLGIANTKETGTKLINVPEGLKTPKAAWEWVESHNYKHSPDLEYFIAKDPKYAYMYAYKVLRPLGKRFWEAEPLVAKSDDWAYFYATNILKSRWAEAEPTIAKWGQFRDMYCKEFGLTYDPTTKTFK